MRGKNRRTVHLNLTDEQKEIVQRAADMFDMPAASFVTAVTIAAAKGVTGSLEAQVQAGLKYLTVGQNKRAPRRTRHDEWKQTVVGQYYLDGYILKKDPERMKDMKQTWKLRRPDGSVEDTGCTNRPDAMAYAVAVMENERERRQG